MRKDVNFFVVLVSLLFATNLKAQSTEMAVATVTIVEPVTVSSNQMKGFETIEVPSLSDLLFRKGNIYLPGYLVKRDAYNSIISAADFTINSSGGYSLTIPQKIVLLNERGNGKITADLWTGGSVQDECMPNGKKHLVISAGLDVSNGHTPGKYTSQAFDVTVNFN